MFLISVILTLAGMYLYLLLKAMDLTRVPKAVAATISVLLAFSMAAFHLSPYFIRESGIDDSRVDLLFWASYGILGFASILFILFLALDLAVVMWRVGRRLFRLMGAFREKKEKWDMAQDPDKRLFLVRWANLGLTGLALGMTGYGYHEARKRPGVVRQKVPIRGLPSDLEGLRIALVSDLHVSATLKKPFVERVVAIVNHLSPDLVAITGDLVDGSVANIGRDVAPLSRLSAPLGIYFVTGNHEYYSGARVWMEAVRQMGLIVLENEHRIVKRGNGRLLVAGVHDFHAERFYPSHASSPSKALMGAAFHHTRILLAHQPRSIFDAARAGFHLQLSGHTHGGQYYPWQCLVSLNQPYVSGLHRHEDMWIYVSRGTGYWGPPVRLGSPSEITEITLAGA